MSDESVSPQSGPKRISKMTDASNPIAPNVDAGKKPARQKARARQSALEKLTSAELQTLRLDEAARAEFEVLARRFNLSRAKRKVFESEDLLSMNDVRYDQHSAAEAEQRGSGMAVVHFMAPRVLRLRDGAAKRKWRSFLTKFRKDEQLG
jgi:hypothetical protein